MSGLIPLGTPVLHTDALDNTIVGQVVGQETKVDEKTGQPTLTGNVLVLGHYRDGQQYLKVAAPADLAAPSWLAALQSDVKAAEARARAFVVEAIAAIRGEFIKAESSAPPVTPPTTT